LIRFPRETVGAPRAKPVPTEIGTFPGKLDRLESVSRGKRPETLISKTKPTATEAKKGLRLRAEKIEAFSRIQTNDVSSFPRSSVGMPSSTLGVVRVRHDSNRAFSGLAKRTRSVPDGIPTEDRRNEETKPSRRNEPFVAFS
jgi:hypothetical protein